MSAATAAAVVGALAAAYGASQSGKAAGKASSSQESAAAEDLAFRREQYQRYLGLMGPIEEKLAAEAKSETPLDYERNAAQIKSNYAAAQRGITSAMGLRGMAGSGLDEAAMRGAAYGQAGDLSNAWAQGLTNKRNLGLTLTGRGQLGQAAQGVQGGLQGMANLYGNQANLYNQAAQAGWSNFGTGLQNIAYTLGNRNNPQTTNVPSQPSGNGSVQTNVIWPSEDQAPLTPYTPTTQNLLW